MARWAPEETDTMAAIAKEVASAHGGTRTFVAVDGEPGTDTERVAAALVAGFTAEGVTAMHAVARATDVDGLRAEVVDPFRTTGTAPGVLVVTGTHLLAASIRPLWHWTLWVERSGAEPSDDDGTASTRRDDPKRHASAVLDVTDPEHPRRNWADAC